MKCFLWASAVVLAAAGCAPVEVQRRPFLQPDSDRQLEFHKRLQERAALRVGDGAPVLSPAGNFGQPESGSPGGSVYQGVANPPPGSVETIASPGQSGMQGAGASGEGAAGGVETPGGSGAAGDSNGPSSESGTPSETAAQEAVSGGPTEGSSIGEDVAVPTSPGGGGGGPKKANPSCERSGGHSATCD